METVYLTIIDRSGDLRTAFEFYADTWAEQLAIGEPVSSEIMVALDCGYSVRVGPGNFKIS